MIDLGEIGFSVDRCDKDGDVWDEGIFLHFGETSICIAENINEYQAFVKKLEDMTQEIEENL